MTVNVSAFSRHDSNGVWSTGYLGAYAQGLGVTDINEGTGSNNRHVVDNIGGDHDYVELEFSSSIVVDQVYLDYVYNGDSDMAIWIGTKPTGHNTLSDAFLTSIGPREDNDTTLTGSRWANVNATNRSGNVIVIAASVADTTPEDTFKLHKLLFTCGGTLRQRQPRQEPQRQQLRLRPRLHRWPAARRIPSSLKAIRRPRERWATSGATPWAA